ncbi:hypothetical protein GCM10020216_005820 [Nonomuraea helvata]
MIAGALIGTLMLASAAILVGGASAGRRLDAVDWHRPRPGARDGSIHVATESRLRITPTALGPSIPGSSAHPPRSPSAHPTHPASVARRPTPKQASSAHSTPRRTISTHPTPGGPSVSRTPTLITVTPAVQPTRPSVAPPPHRRHDAWPHSRSARSDAPPPKALNPSFYGCARWAACRSSGPQPPSRTISVLFVE